MFGVDECLYVLRRGSHLIKKLIDLTGYALYNNIIITFKNLIFKNSLIIHKGKKKTKKLRFNKMSLHLIKTWAKLYIQFFRPL